MNERQLKRLLPNISKDVLRLNIDRSSNSRSTAQSKSVDRKAIREAQGNDALGKAYKLSLVQVTFFARHGQTLDEDNRKFLFKPGLDALVNLRVEKSDREIQTEVTQRMDESDIGLF